ncbi:NDP-sugar synthase [Halapricum hydrolyticum]|uniref:NDP-sugar synthase n=1 Tax=Halapricum hydrolyticum TaxID=2979991 RepID=A0AAE3IDI1_9EURY|nr:NDP-sugar synthase [Halapricum hydrolyticum]MCU4719166.1 NDP-sugar synthase [Halapricum hydrolyticum]MCU4728257.1 NDP-sugar synthase [Halapricum hydrolyticum]
MHAVVLAGGYATRLWPITKNRPKMFLPVGEAAVIDRVLSDLESDDRIEDVYVSTNERFAEDFETHLRESDFEKPRLSIEETTAENEKFGVVGALAQLVEREGIGGEDLLVAAGDNLISFDVDEFIDSFEAYGATTIAAYDVGSLEKATEYGVVELDGDRVVDFQEKPDDPTSTLVSIACYAFPSEAIRFEEYLAAGNNPDEPGWFVQWLVEDDDVYAYSFDEAWFDIGTPESYLEAVAWELDGENRIADGATVENAEIGSNVHVADGAEIIDSTLERSVVFPETTVRDCELRDSIIDRDTHLANLDLGGALIGAHTKIANGE